MSGRATAAATATATAAADELSQPSRPHPKACRDQIYPVRETPHSDLIPPIQGLDFNIFLTYF